MAGGQERRNTPKQVLARVSTHVEEGNRAAIVALRKLGIDL
jgi:hypothetical protein